MHLRPSFPIAARVFTVWLLLVAAAPTRGAEKNLEGTVNASEIRSGVTTSILYTRKGDQFRVEILQTDKPMPINLVDLAAKKLTILYPHNHSFAVIDLTPEEKAPQPSAVVQTPPMPAPNAGPGAGFSPPPGFPSMPPLPSAPNNPATTGMPIMPRNPLPAGAPPIPAMMGAKPEFKKNKQAKKIQGFDCMLYTVSDRMETMEIWATSDSTLFPFRLLQTSYHPRNFGPEMLEKEWAALLQRRNLFPLEVTLKINGQEQARYTFRVDRIDRRQIEDPALFKVPDGYMELEAPKF